LLSDLGARVIKVDVGNPLRFSGTPLEPGKGSPTLGEDTDALLSELGLSAEEISRHRMSGVVK